MFHVRRNSSTINLLDHEDDVDTGSTSYAPLASQPDLEASARPSASSSTLAEEREEQNAVYRRQVSFAVKASVTVNLLLFFVKGSAWYLTHSYAIFSSLVDSTVDLVNQLVLFFAERNMAMPSERFPAGKTRLEPVAIIIGAVLMCTLSLNVMRLASEGLYDGFAGRGKPTLEVTPLTQGILITATTLKVGLFFMCNRLRKVSGTAMALAEDHRNDVISNMAAIVTSSFAGAYPKVWWLDPVGALVISMYIIWCWVTIGQEQVNFVVGEKGDDDIHEEVGALASAHHPELQVDQLRVYHIGRHYLVELEVVMPPETPLRIVHDVSLDLQTKIEQVPDIERAFVHVDYESREYLEHKEPRLL
uniref:Cation efflux protein cytoplasmic domain-containing protein n=1 Tax=Pyramimonas obovata TaxID=1411642 RepID=A0A7S0MQG6_9CHLO|mmetsp:Transcript_10768/g.22432  ORF Transcript_10768/g.22432 Transcript_10768/m.22432 type:complete len:361 (+) Transcript_10768:240-1322(+)|eukprot:CAMPEP_0118933396 /NCGR_PEP_ID=MMETSP1169-20130426/11965_1 /TAXON_ID=36882 /ORGANISM="Pyramimonas obovata, Strain CCMP722" /LENGTH=360 /DNA_ID=CAMNT_0006876151 /DNA_START=219 /DNA_END=1301 /DNA_ORIENTATION=+